MSKREKVYITRDEGSDKIWIWRSPIKNKGNNIPEKLKDCEIICWQRIGSMSEINSYSAYTVKDFKKKFGFIIKKKQRKLVQIDKELLNNQDYQLFSNNPKRKTWDFPRVRKLRIRETVLFFPEKNIIDIKRKGIKRND